MPTGSAIPSVISILAAIALPAYQNYMQRSANNACMAEAKSWINTAVSDFAINGASSTFPTPANKACAVSAVATSIAKPTTRGVDATGTEITAWADFKDDLYFAPKTRGNLDEWKQVKCSAKTSSCELANGA